MGTTALMPLSRPEADQVIAELQSLVRQMEPRRRLGFLFQLLEAMDTAGLDFNECGDCLIEELGHRVQTGEW